MAEFGVGFKLYADAQGFVSGTKEAQESAKNLKNELKETFGESGLFSKISLIGGITAVATGILSAANAAQELRDKAKEAGETIDKVTATTARFGDTIDAIKASVKGALIEVIGYHAMAGEKIAELYLQYFKGMSKANVDAIGEIETQTIETFKRIKEAREANSPEKLAEAEKKLAEIREQEAIKRASNEDKIVLLLEQQARLNSELSELGVNTIKHKEKQAEIEKNATALLEVQNAYIKEMNDNNEKLNKSRDDAAEKELKVLRDEQRLLDRLADARFTQLSTEEKILVIEKDIAATQNRIVQDQKLGNSTVEDQIELINLQNKLVATQRDLAAERLQIEKQTAQVEQQRIAFGMTLRGQSQFSKASDEALQETVRRNEQQAINLLQTPEGMKYDRGEAARLQLEAQNARRELQFRESLRQDVRTLGVEGARSQFRGDPLAFDTLIQRFVTDTRSNAEIQKEQTDQLRDLNARLSKFGLTK